jgi:hypothetical protein
MDVPPQHFFHGARVAIPAGVGRRRVSERDDVDFQGDGAVINSFVNNAG